MQWDVTLLEFVDSTNSYAKSLAIEGAKEGTVIIAETQKNGRGRLGRVWDSADGKGIWMSLILRPSISPQSMLIITQAASVAIINALTETVGVNAFIKWPNDIMISNKKLCGILTEMSAEADLVNYVILGVGINIYHSKEDFSDGIKDKAISLQMYQDMNKDDIIKSKMFKPIERDQLISSILMNIEDQYKKVIEGKSEEILTDWKRHSLMLDKRITFEKDNCYITGVVQGISNNGGLIVVCDSGIRHEVIYGEITLQG